MKKTTFTCVSGERRRAYKCPLCWSTYDKMGCCVRHLMNKHHPELFNEDNLSKLSSKDKQSLVVCLMINHKTVPMYLLNLFFRLGKEAR